MNKKPRLILLLAFTLLVLMHNASTPVFEAPDEVWHYAYVRWLAGGGGLPSMDDNASGANQEVAQPPLYYAVAAFLSAPFPDDDLKLWSNPGFGYQSPGTSGDNKNMLIHTPDEGWPWRGGVLTLHVTRLTSLLFGLVTVVAAWSLGAEAFGTQRGARTTAMLVAFHPQFVFLCGVVSNDSAAAALSTAALWAVARVLRRGITVRRAAITGALVGLAALTKTSAILLLPLAGLALLWAVWRQTKTRFGNRGYVSLMVFGVVALAVGGWWYGRNFVLYGDPLGISSHADTPWGRSETASLLELLPEIPLLLRSFWAAYGWGHVTWPGWVYWALWTGALLLLTRSVWRIAVTFNDVRRKRGRSRLGANNSVKPNGIRRSSLVSKRERPWAVLAQLLPTSAALCGPKLQRRRDFRSRLSDFFPRTRTYPRKRAGHDAKSELAVLIFALVWFGGILGALLRWMQQVEAPHGRLLFPAIGAFALLLANGTGGKKQGLGIRKGTRVHVKWHTLYGNSLILRFAHSLIRSFADSPIRFFVVFAFALTALAPGARILATFALPRLRQPSSAMRGLPPVDLHYAKTARLLGVSMDVDRAAPDETVTVKACWEALAPMSEEYTVFVHLIGPENSRVAERHTYPGLGRFPTSLWPVGRAFCDTYRLQIEPWAEEPIRYKLEVGLFDAETGERLPATRADGSSAEPPVVGAISVVTETPAATAPTHPIIATWNDTIALRGFDGTLTAAPGETVDITLHWEALGAPEGDLAAFVHLWQPGDDVPLAQHDSPPRQGWYPTTVWQTGDRVPDTHPLEIPADLPPGTYPLWAGLYRVADGVRLAAEGPEGEYPHNLVPLGTLEIK